MLRFWDMILKAILVVFLTNGAFTIGIVQEIDMFKEVGLLDKPLPQGVTSTQGQNSNSRAFHFTTQAQNLLANQNAFNNADTLIHDSQDFWVSAWVKLDTNNPNDNTILSISSADGNDLYFKLKISGVSANNGLKVEVSVRQAQGIDPSPIEALSDQYADTVEYQKWNKVAVRLQEGERVIRIYIKDMVIPAKVDVLPRIAPFPANVQLRLAQELSKGRENQITIIDKFKGDLQDVKLMRGNLNDCPPLTTCKCSDALQQKKCVMDGLRYNDGARWTKNNCSVCKCESGHVTCTYTCKVCVDNGQQYFQDETWKMSNNTCYTCRCQDGQSTCNPPSCPVTSCPSGKTVLPEGECCEICQEEYCERKGKEYKSYGGERTCVNPSGSCSPCKEGCFCKRGEILNSRGECEANSNCGCIYKGKEYKSGGHHLDKCTYLYCAGTKTTLLNFCGK